MRQSHAAPLSKTVETQVPMLLSMNTKTRCLMTHILIPLLIGTSLGALMGYFGQCNSGTCPLTSTWWRGAIYGGVLGLLFAFGSRR